MHALVVRCVEQQGQRRHAGVRSCGLRDEGVRQWPRWELDIHRARASGGGRPHVWLAASTLHWISSVIRARRASRWRPGQDQAHRPRAAEPSYTTASKRPALQEQQGQQGRVQGKKQALSVRRETHRPPASERTNTPASQSDLRSGSGHWQSVASVPRSVARLRLQRDADSEARVRHGARRAAGACRTGGADGGGNGD